jgi:beta-glucosidase
MRALKLIWDRGVGVMETRRSRERSLRHARVKLPLLWSGSRKASSATARMLSLPGHQEALIKAVAATGVPTTVVIVGGSAVTMSRWLGDVGAVLFAWYPGEEGGEALADVLWGDVSPSGRLPITFPVSEGQLPLTYDHKPTGRGDDYVDLTGQPLFPFGHGLSYTTFAYSDLRIEQRRDHGDTVADGCGAACGEGTCARAGDQHRYTRGSEVVQLYLRDVLTSVSQPLIATQGFHAFTLQPGASAEVQFTLSAEQLQLLNEDMRWVVEPGVFRVMVGASSKDIKLRGEFTLR